jgi:hypothetical protein
VYARELSSKVGGVGAGYPIEPPCRRHYGAIYSVRYSSEIIVLAAAKPGGK